MPCNPLQLRQLKPKIRGNLNQCPKMVPQNHTTKVLILQVELCSRTMTEKAYFCGRMALWHQITRILSKPHPHPKGHDSLPVVFLIFYRAGKIVPYVGWSQLTKQPGDEGARQSVILSLLVDHSLFLHPDQQHQLKNNLPAYTVGSLRANVQVECLVNVIDDLVSSDDPQEQLKRFTNALHEVFAFGSSKKHMNQRQLGRLEPTPYLKYRVEEVMRHMPMLST
jgi:hypothetical protein